MNSQHAEAEMAESDRAFAGKRPGADAGMACTARALRQAAAAPPARAGRRTAGAAGRPSASRWPLPKLPSKASRADGRAAGRVPAVDAWPAARCTSLAGKALSSRPASAPWPSRSRPPIGAARRSGSRRRAFAVRITGLGAAWRPALWPVWSKATPRPAAVSKEYQGQAKPTGPLDALPADGSARHLRGSPGILT